MDTSKKRKIIFFVVIADLIVFAVLGIAFLFTYNDLVDANNRVDEARAQIETAYQRRADLVPNLVSSVKAYVKHEKSVLENITKLRASINSLMPKSKGDKNLSSKDIKKYMESQKLLGGAIKQLFAVSENYPDLKASENFLALQDQLEGTENRINMTRQFYNSTVRKYNTKVKRFPGNLVAPLFDMKVQPFFKSSKGSSEAVKVKF